MAKTVVNPQAQLASLPGDVELSLDQLALLEVLASLKKAPAFAKFPGTYVLRHYRKGDVICRQGDAGGTAFYMLTGKDVAALAEQTTADAKEKPAGSSSSRQEFVQLAQRMRPTADVVQPRRLATARLMVDMASAPQVRGSKSWRTLWRGGGKNAAGPVRPAVIANDGPTDIDYQTRQAAIHEGEVFGEMSCLTRQPRSATIVVDTECFALEILRNILDQMRKDPEYKQLSDRQYRQRVLQGHLRQLSIFKLLSDREFNDVVGQVELQEFAAGTVIWDEGDASDSLYVVRSGLVQVVQSFPWQLSESAVTDWPQLLKLLGGKGEVSPAIQRVIAALPKDLQEALAAPTDSPQEGIERRIVDILNQLAKTDSLLSAKEMQAAMSEGSFRRESADYPAKAKSWTGLQLRRGNRLLYHLLFPKMIAPPEPVGLARVLQYLGRGGILGEIGVLLGQPRSATCVAYSHPEADRESTDVELVRVPAEVVWKLAAQSPAVQTEINKLAAARKQRDRTGAKIPLAGEFQSRRVEELGLQQGQNLMLIDLDRCTRCGDCVEACIATHDDGHSRLFLDGPRFGKYLVPSSCRLCRDPVCMIGCPVGSIQLGEAGEVVIREWCIGCGVCARQCPYDSIQMHDTAVVPSGAPGWRWIQDLNPATSPNWKELRYKSSDWNSSTTPFRCDIELQQAVASPLVRGGRAQQVKRLYFRHEFESQQHLIEGSESFELTATSQGSALEVYLNGQTLQLTQDAAQKKRGQYVATIAASALRPGTNVFAARVDVPGEFGAMIFDLWLDRTAPESAEFEEKAVTERAVVCDQCSSLSGNRQACVYACPHEAALRVDAWIDLPTM